MDARYYLRIKSVKPVWDLIKCHDSPFKIFTQVHTPCFLHIFLTLNMLYICIHIYIFDGRLNPTGGTRL